MKLILGHNIDWRLKKDIVGHDVRTVQELGWADVINGELLTLVEEAGFHLLLTADANIKQQQNMTGRKIAIIVLRSRNNRLATHRDMVDDILAAVQNVEPGHVVEIFHPDTKASD